MRLNLRNNLLALTLLAASAASASAASIVVNGDFSTGNFSGWVHNTSSSDPWTVDSNGSGYYASTGCVGPQCITGTPSQQAYLYQDLSTIAGDTYTLSFQFTGAGAPMELEVLFGSTVAEDLVNIPTSSLNTYTITGLVATSGTTRLEFLGRQDPGFDYLDNISVTGNTSAATPEPASLSLFGTGVLALVGVARRKLRV